MRAGWPGAAIELMGIDNFARAGSETNRIALRREGVEVHHGDLRLASDLEAIGPVDWVLDAAALPSVLAGVDGSTSSRQLVEHNLIGTLNLLEFCKRSGAGLVLLSTSRVYSVSALAGIQVEARGEAFALAAGVPQPSGLSANGLTEAFSTSAPISLYGATKLASEHLALEYGAAFDFPVWINRCGALAGAGQFGRADQGILPFWIHSWLRGRPLRYVGFGGRGLQVRDFLHPRDLAPFLIAQMERGTWPREPIVNLGGGLPNSLSLAQLSAWCEARFGPRSVGVAPDPRPFDAPWVVMDTARADHLWGFRAQTPLEDILREIAGHAEKNPDWLEISG